MEADWANLDALALNLILENLKESIDHIWFGAVCKSWQSVAKIHHQIQPFKSNAVPPMLMFHAERGTNFYSIPGARVHYCPSFEFPMPQFVCCLAFHHGWFATWTSACCITLRNPFKNVAPIVLPTHSSRFVFGSQMVILSSDPITSANDYVVAAIDPFHRISFIRAGQECWTTIRRAGFFTNIAFYKGLIYAVEGSSKISIVSLDPSSKEKTIPDRVLQGRHDDHDSDLYKNVTTINHLVESLEGDLWVVRQFGVHFHVYKLEQNNGKLVRLKSLGDNVVFLDRLRSVSVSFSDFSNCLHKDSIYYHPHLPSLGKESPANFTTYNIKDGRHRRYDCGTAPPSKERPFVFWIQPPF